MNNHVIFQRQYRRRNQKLTEEQKCRYKASVDSSKGKEIFTKKELSKSSPSILVQLLSVNPGKKSKMRDRHRAHLAEKKSRAQRYIICICSCALEFFPESALGDGPEKWHIFLFNTVSYHTYLHMPFEVGIIR